jgi:secreted trypsin-like serine protease
MASLRFFVASILAALSLAAAPSASAIVGGEADTERDFVVLVKVQVLLPGAPGWLSPGTCSGTLVDADTVVTAAHCGIIPPLPPGSQVRFLVVQGDSLASATATSVGTFIPHPGFCVGCPGGPPGFPANNDLAVIQLQTPLPGPYANLPKEGWVGKHFEREKQLVVLGYGLTQPRLSPTDPVVGLDTRRSVQARAYVLPSAPNFLELPSPSKDKYGSGCSGDSGGANLVGNTLVAVSSIGDNACNGPNYAFRIDTASAREFLAQFVDLR